MVDPVQTLPSLSQYATARDLFDATRDASIDADRIARTLRRMGSREGVRAQSYEPHGRRGSIGDAMQATDARIDYERRVRERQRSDYALIDIACDVLYGHDQVTGGLAVLMGAAYADCLWWRYCAAATWGDTARGCGMSERWCRDAIAPAMDTMDAYGLERVSRGLGLASV
jgi:hypothetical protein